MVRRGRRELTAWLPDRAPNYSKSVGCSQGAQSNEYDYQEVIGVDCSVLCSKHVDFLRHAKSSEDRSESSDNLAIFKYCMPDTLFRYHWIPLPPLHARPRSSLRCYRYPGFPARGRRSQSSWRGGLVLA